MKLRIASSWLCKWPQGERVSKDHFGALHFCHSLLRTSAVAHARARCRYCCCLRVKFPAFVATAVAVDAGVDVVATLSLGSTASTGNVKHFPVTHFVDSAAVAVAASASATAATARTTVVGFIVCGPSKSLEESLKLKCCCAATILWPPPTPATTIVQWWAGREQLNFYVRHAATFVLCQNLCCNSNNKLRLVAKKVDPACCASSSKVSVWLVKCDKLAFNCDCRSNL